MCGSRRLSGGESPLSIFIRRALTSSMSPGTLREGRRGRREREKGERRGEDKGKRRGRGEGRRWKGKEKLILMK